MALTARLAPPLAAFLLARAVLATSAAASGYAPLRPETFLRWDSHHYLSVAERGYELFSCARLPGYDPRAWCGNAAWLPGYPLAIRLLAALGPRPALAGAILSGLFHLATLLLLWNGFLGAALEPRAFLVLTLAALFPGQVYQHAIFPISACVFLLLAAMRLLLAGRPAAAGIAGGLAAFTYPTGVLFALPAALHLLLEARPLRERIARAAAASGITALGFAAVLAWHQFALGAWDAFFRVTAKYGFGVHLPLATLVDRARPIAAGDWRLALPGVQGLLAAALVVALVAAAALARDREPSDRLLAAHALLYWLFPLALGGGLSLYRAEALLLPAVPLARRLPLPLLAAFTAAAALLAPGMAALFYRGVLV